MSLTIGSLCSGYGGLDLAVESFFSAETKWFSEFDPAPSKVLAHHWPGVPNLGDMTVIDWATVEPVDIIAGGTPCQDLSGAGKRAGMAEGTRSNLWVQMREAVAVIRPKYVVWENVRGAYSAYAVSEVESETGLLGGYGADRPALRALGRVLGDLSDLGYDTQWVGVRAADVGAPHGRFRVFVLAHAASERRGEGWPESAGVERRPDNELRGTGIVADPERLGWPEGCKEPGSSAQFADYVGGLGASGVGGETCDEGITAADSESVGRGLRNTVNEWAPGGGVNPFGDSRNAGSGTVGTPPAAADSRCDESERWGRPNPVGGTPSTSQTGREERQRVRNTTCNSGTTLTDTDHTGCSKQRGTVTVQPEHTPTEHGSSVDWGVYEPAIERWSGVLGRVAPAPTEPTGKGGAHRLSPRFVEWMMGLKPGHVTDPAIGLTRNQQLKALGNGVVPQQAELALTYLLGIEIERAA